MPGAGHPVYSFADERWKIFFRQPPNVVINNQSTGTSHTIPPSPQWAEGGGQTLVEYLVIEGVGKQYILDWGYKYLEDGTPNAGHEISGGVFTLEAAAEADFLLVDWWRWGPSFPNILEGAQGFSIHVLVDSCSCMAGYLCDQDPVQWPDGSPDEAGINALISRLYKELWLEDAAQGNIDYWRINLISGEETVQDLLVSLMGDGRYQDRNLTDQQYLETIHRALFGSEIQSQDLQGWLDQLTGGSMTRDDILREILLSDDFMGLCARLGISATPLNV
ncbi:MAG: DUF4214 domain-containing protein [Deltaproteobacteria bacterium]|nr:DUF4214 domain-containing protein [Deltaproteobacteria bacterium]